MDFLVRFLGCVPRIHKETSACISGCFRLPTSAQRRDQHAGEQPRTHGVAPQWGLRLRCPTTRVKDWRMCSPIFCKKRLVTSKIDTEKQEKYREVAILIQINHVFLFLFFALVVFSFIITQYIYCCPWRAWPVLTKISNKNIQSCSVKILFVVCFWPEIDQRHHS